MSQKKTTEEFIEEARKIHGSKYDYSKVNYVNNHTKVEIICPEHGSFFQIPSNHLQGQNCPKCKKKNICKKLSKTTEQFIEEARKIHGDKYDYSKVNYINNSTKIEIICPKHGSFFQIPFSHLRGNDCTMCTKNNSHFTKKKTAEEFIEEAKKIH